MNENEHTIEMEAGQPAIQLIEDIKSDLEADRGYYHIDADRQTIRIYTRESRRPEHNRNGGDYDYWTDYRIEDNSVIAETGWSAEFCPREWNVFSRTIYRFAAGFSWRQLVHFVQSSLVVFDFDAAIEATRRAEAERWANCDCGCGDGNDYDFQWSVDLHALANGVLLPVLVLVWSTVLTLVGVAVAAL
jgi:hypothetical protein